MKRRDFLKALAAVPAATAVPVGAAVVPSGRSLMLKYSPSIAEAYYSAAIFGSGWFDIRRFDVQMNWRYHYGAWRRARQRGDQVDETLRDVMEIVRAETMEMKAKLRAAFEQGEVGTYESVRFIETDLA